jgi:hypothetical protein
VKAESEVADLDVVGRRHVEDGDVLPGEARPGAVFVDR